MQSPPLDDIPGGGHPYPPRATWVKVARDRSPSLRRGRLARASRRGTRSPLYTHPIFHCRIIYDYLLIYWHSS